MVACGLSELSWFSLWQVLLEPGTHWFFPLYYSNIFIVNMHVCAIIFHLSLSDVDLRMTTKTTTKVFMLDYCKKRIRSISQLTMFGWALANLAMFSQEIYAQVSPGVLICCVGNNRYPTNWRHSEVLHLTVNSSTFYDIMLFTIFHTHTVFLIGIL